MFSLTYRRCTLLAVQLNESAQNETRVHCLLWTRRLTATPRGRPHMGVPMLSVGWRPASGLAGEAHALRVGRAPLWDTPCVLFWVSAVLAMAKGRHGLLVCPVLLRTSLCCAVERTPRVGFGVKACCAQVQQVNPLTFQQSCLFPILTHILYSHAAVSVTTLRSCQYLSVINFSHFGECIMVSLQVL